MSPADSGSAVDPAGYISRQEFEARFDRVDREVGQVSDRIDQLSRRVPTEDTIKAAVAESRQSNPTMVIAMIALGFTFWQLLSANQDIRFRELQRTVSDNYAEIRERTTDRVTRTQADGMYLQLFGQVRLLDEKVNRRLDTLESRIYDHQRATHHRVPDDGD